MVGMRSRFSYGSKHSMKSTVNRPNVVASTTRDPRNAVVTDSERKQIEACRPDMRGPKSAIDSAAWAQVNMILKKRGSLPPG